MAILFYVGGCMLSLLAQSDEQLLHPWWRAVLVMLLWPLWVPFVFVGWLYWRLACR